MKQEYIRAKDLSKILNLSLTTIWRLNKAPDFPKAIKLTSRCTVWKLDEINNWLESRKGEKDEF